MSLSAVCSKKNVVRRARSAMVAAHFDIDLKKGFSVKLAHCVKLVHLCNLWNHLGCNNTPA